MAEKKEKESVKFDHNTENIEKTQDFKEEQKTDDTSVSEVIKEKLLELVDPKKAAAKKAAKKEAEQKAAKQRKKEGIKVVEKEEKPEVVVPTEIITQKLAPKDTFIPFSEMEENDMHFSKKIELNEMTFDDVSIKQNLTDEDFEQVLKNDNKKIELYSDEYVYINVMETFVKEIIVDYMKQYGTCTCNHCVIDTMALTLTNLPSKYVVVKKGDLAPLLHMYRQKYSIQISAELLKACLVVSGSPHHKKSE